MKFVGITLTFLYILLIIPHCYTRPRFEDNVIEKFISCLLGEGHCDTVGKNLKFFVPEVMRGRCLHCTEHDKMDLQSLVILLQRTRPSCWSAILDHSIRGLDTPKAKRAIRCACMGQC